MRINVSSMISYNTNSTILIVLSWYNFWIHILYRNGPLNLYPWHISMMVHLYICIYTYELYKVSVNYSKKSIPFCRRLTFQVRRIIEDDDRLITQIMICPWALNCKLTPNVNTTIDWTRGRYQIDFMEINFYGNNFS